MRYFPLYEAKMFHQFDHRWATFTGVDPLAEEDEEEALEEEESDEDEGGSDKSKTRDCTLAEKQDSAYLPTPRYWVSEADVLLRAVPLSRDEKKELAKVSPDEVVRRLRPRAPKWLVAFRDITNATNEHTAIFSVLPLVGCGNNAPILEFHGNADNGPLLATLMSGLVTDYIARNKLGGTHLNAFYLYQAACLAPDQLIDRPELPRLKATLIELLYTSEHLRPLAASLGYDGDPFPFDPQLRSELRAELDALVARLYGLNRKQLRYILCPRGLSWSELEDVNDGWEDPSCSGPHFLPAEPAEDFPGETFRVLKEKEEKQFGEYRTRRLILEAWERLWNELGPIEPLPVRFGPNAPPGALRVAERVSGSGEAEPGPGQLLDVPIATGLFASPSDVMSRQTPAPAPNPPAASRPVADEEADDFEDEEDDFELVPPETKPLTPLRDKAGRPIRVRVLGASGQEILAAATVVGQRKQGEVVEWSVLPDGAPQPRKFLSPPAEIERIGE